MGDDQMQYRHDAQTHHALSALLSLDMDLHRNPVYSHLSISIPLSMLNRLNNNTGQHRTNLATCKSS